MFSYESQGTNTYLVYSVEDTDTIDTMSLGMLTNNKIAGLAGAVYSQVNEQAYIKYNVSAKVPASDIFSGAVNKKRLTGVFKGIISAMLSAEDYMIDSKNILLDLNYIFSDVSTCETILICLPVVNDESEPQDLGMFFKELIFKTQFEQTENCDYVAKIISYLNSSPVFSLSGFGKVIDDISKGESQTIQVRQIKPKETKAPASAGSVQQKSAAQTPYRQQNSSERTAQQLKTPNASAGNMLRQANPYPAQSVSDNTIPAMQNKNPVPQELSGVQSEKKMTFMNLMMHYSKENAAIYKRQKEAKKNSKSAAPVNQKADKPKKSQTQQGFAIPGQESVIAPAADASARSRQAQNIAPQSQPLQSAVYQAPPQSPPVQTPYQGANYNAAAYQSPVQMPSSKPMSFGDTTLLDNAGASPTTVLNQQTEAAREHPRLIRASTGEVKEINKPIWHIGKERSYVDYFIGDNSSISRSHANIISRDGRYYVVDTNSSNHTYVNGTMIQSNTEVEITHGTKLRFSNEDFEFVLY